MNKILTNINIINICLLVLLFVVVTILFVFCLKIYKFNRNVEKENEIKHIKLRSDEFICRINLDNFDYRKRTLTSLICDTLMLPTSTRINHNPYTGRAEVDNYPYEGVFNNDYLYIYKRELK